MTKKIEKTQEQKNCIKFEGKPLIIQAGPGAGKTYVLIERIKYLLNGDTKLRKNGYGSYNN